MSIDALSSGADFDFGDFDFSTTCGSMGERDVTRITERTGLDLAPVSKTTSLYLLIRKHLEATALMANKDTRVGVSGGATQESNGDRKAEAGVYIEKETSEGVSFSASAGVGIQQDSNGDVSKNTHIEGKFEYKF
ncbi:MAG: hypothetical protein Q8L98_01940 [Chlamydiales bacterium]|nr:hypothetical protein [Chlamydiales bacterium]